MHLYSHLHHAYFLRHILYLFLSISSKYKVSTEGKFIEEKQNTKHNSKQDNTHTLNTRIIIII